MKTIAFNKGALAIDGKIEFDLNWCYKQMKAWRSRFFRKTSIYPATIEIKCFSPGDDIDYWVTWLELYRTGQMVEQHRIKQEAYNELSNDTSLIKRTYVALHETVTILESFSPNNLNN